MNPLKLKTLVFYFTLFILISPILDWWHAVTGEAAANLSPLSFLQIIRGIFLFIMFFLLSNNIPHFRIFPLLKPLCALILFYTLMLPVHGDFLGNAAHVFQMLYVFFFAIGGYAIAANKENADDWLIKVAWCLLAITIALQMYGFFTGERIYEYAIAAAGGKTAMTAIPLAVGISLLMTKFKKMRYRDWGMLFLAVGMLIMTMRRGIILGVLFGFAVTGCMHLFAWRSRAQRKLLRRFIFLFCFLFAFGFFLSQTPAAEAFQKRIERMNIFQQEPTQLSRINLWEASFKAAMDRPFDRLIFGDGDARVHAVVGTQWGRPLAPHNAWIRMLISGGLIALFLFLWLHVAILGQFFHIRRHVPDILPAFVIGMSALILWGLTGGPVFSPGLALMFFLNGYCQGKIRNVRYTSSIPQTSK